jgi:hypothetical protein
MYPWPTLGWFQAPLDPHDVVDRLVVYKRYRLSTVRHATFKETDRARHRQAEAQLNRQRKREFLA